MAAVCNGPFLNIWSHDTDSRSLKFHMSCLVDGAHTHHRPQLMLSYCLDRRNQGNYLDDILLWAQSAGYTSQKAPPPQPIQLTACVSLNQDVPSVRKSFPEVV